MQELPLTLSLFLNLIIQLILIYLFSRQPKQNNNIAKKYFTFISFFLTICISLFGCVGLIYLFELFDVKVDTGHSGVGLIIPFAVNLLVGLISIYIGPIVLGWNKIKW